MIICIFQFFQEVANETAVLEQSVQMPKDLANSIVFLASEKASKITGVNLPVDSGNMVSSRQYNFADKPSDKLF